MTPVIRIESIGKTYRVNHAEVRLPYRTLRDTLARAATAPIRRWRAGGHAGVVEQFWALKDVSFNVQAGEVVGIIGRNGAGKSTLLKILSQITKPTCGLIVLRGRVGCLLEVGTGFHQELTGRENIYMNGSILGMNRTEIRNKFDEIVDFSGVEKFLDTPVKRYSSGMQVRLAFAVAAHLEPEIVIVDEVLAVGDVEFQRKCLGKMGDVARSGRTVALVSHNMAAIKSLCTRAILLRQGRVVSIGPTNDVVDEYLSEESKIAETGLIPDDAPRIGTGTAKVRSVDMTTIRGVSVRELYFKQPFRVTATLEALEVVPDAFFEISISTRDGLQVTNSSTMDNSGSGVVLQKGCHQIEATFDFNLLPGRYCVGIGIFRYTGTNTDWMERALDFEVRKITQDGSDCYRWNNVRGFVRPEVRWSLPREDENCDFSQDVCTNGRV
jgi:lipopolysaccharide transport system ATP-binding protein